ncbi:response regulator [Flavitalea sp. BT771]|uniref:response regulator n=1 Tax=Flavitalea sp. BT771 TaxID=3063329 RepID=UPI0026E43D12|nr:response regulator [Flavitalea sp. BT771]MDO6432726.1 response regulator [Flavitalea sp. BT771]MDV6221998.1 response regulator [Flavitalea sp. BT771]
MRFIFFVSGVVLLVTCITFFVYEYYTFRKTTIEKLTTIGKLISANSSAALAFENHEDAKEILAALKAEPHIAAACLYDKDGGLFSQYRGGPAGDTFPDKPGAEGYRFVRSNLELFLPVMQESRQLGTFYLRSDLGAMYERFRLYGIVVASVIAMCILLAYLLSSILQKSISKPILALAATAKVISDKGDYSLRATRRGKDELGSLTDAFNYMLGQIQAKNQDLHDLTQTLEQKVAERTVALEGKNHLLTGISEINDTLRGIQDVPALAQDIINKLTRVLKAQIGAVYMREGNNELHWVAGYAFSKAEQEQRIIKIGEGLVGQAALEKKAILLSEVPDDYVKINSGMGNTPPKYIIVYPFLYEGFVKGVIEIGSIHPFSDIDSQLLDLMSENIAIAFNSSQSRTHLKELLEETQRQAEELQAQQEELQQTNEVLEEKAGELALTTQYKSQFLANMSHELRTPLNSILILARLLADKKHTMSVEKEKEYAQNIHNSGTDLLNLIDEILDLSKVEAGKIELDMQQVNIDEISDNLRSMFTEIANNRSIDFAIIQPTENFSPSLYTDKQRLGQILRNLLSNAFKFTGKGGKVTLNISVAPPGDQIAFSVTDTGIGIPKDKQKIIFQAFQQADGSTKRKYGGTGLGLSISQELAHALGGELVLESEEGKGSRFTCYLPLTSASSLMTSEPASLPPAPDTGDDRSVIRENDKIVLIIEEDEPFAKLLLDSLRERNYKGILTHQPGIGPSLARFYQPHIITLDLCFPLQDSYEVLRQLKNSPDLRHIPVQVFSEYDGRKESLALGAFDFIKKPASEPAIQAAFSRIEEFIRRKLKKLLVVEDNEQENKAICELIGNGDIRSFPVFRGSDAYEIMRKEKFDCAIVDLGLPDMSGIDLLEKIKATDGLDKMPIIVYTGKDLDREQIAYLNKLADTIVLKTANSKQRLLDEVALFLHRGGSTPPGDTQQVAGKPKGSNEVLKNRKVLIVDDDLRNSYSLTNALEEDELRCITAENGRAAITLLNEHPDTDIILMDVMMPEMDGYEATREIRKMDKFGKLPIIALTAKAMKVDREKCLEAGMSDYISKPVDMDLLLSLMRVWLHRE